MKNQEAFSRCLSRVSLLGRCSCRGWAWQLGRRLCSSAHRCPCCCPRQRSICSQETGESSRQLSHRRSENPWSSWRESEWRCSSRCSLGFLCRSTWPKRTGRHTSTWKHVNRYTPYSWNSNNSELHCTAQEKFQMKMYRRRRASNIEWSMMIYLPNKQGSADPL